MRRVYSAGERRAGVQRSSDLTWSQQNRGLKDDKGRRGHERDASDSNLKTRTGLIQEGKTVKVCSSIFYAIQRNKRSG